MNDPSVLYLKRDGCWLWPRHARCLLGRESVRLAPDSILGDFTAPGPEKVQVTVRGAVGTYSFDFPIWVAEDACASHLLYLASRILAQWAPNAVVLLLGSGPAWESCAFCNGACTFEAHRRCLRHPGCQPGAPLCRQGKLPRGFQPERSSCC